MKNLKLSDEPCLFSVSSRLGNPLAKPAESTGGGMEITTAEEDNAILKELLAQLNNLVSLDSIKKDVNLISCNDIFWQTR